MICRGKRSFNCLHAELSHTSSSAQSLLQRSASAGMPRCQPEHAYLMPIMCSSKKDTEFPARSPDPCWAPCLLAITFSKSLNRRPRTAVETSVQAICVTPKPHHRGCSIACRVFRTWRCVQSSWLDLSMPVPQTQAAGATPWRMSCCVCCWAWDGQFQENV